MGVHERCPVSQEIGYYKRISTPQFVLYCYVERDCAGFSGLAVELYVGFLKSKPMAFAASSGYHLCP